MSNPPQFTTRVCPEHLCKLFNDNRIVERVKSGEFRMRVESTRKLNPFIDQHGNECWWNDLAFITDPKFKIGDLRHDVTLRAHRHRTDDGKIGASGEWDPSKALVQINGIVYERFRTKNGREPHCYLCENGDMIPLNKRFRDSTYRPVPT